MPDLARAVIHRLAGVGGWWLADRVVTLFAAFISQLVLVRVLGSVGYGELSYLLALTSLLLPIAQMGLSGLVVQAILSSESDEQQVLQSALWLRAIGAAAACAFGLLYWSFAESRPSERIVFVVLCLSQLATIFSVIEFRFQARMRPHELVPMRMLVVLGSTVLRLWVAFSVGSVTAVVLIYALENLLIAMCHLLAYRRTTGRWLWPKRDLFWNGWFLQRAPWLLVSGLASVVYLKIDIVMMERLRGPAETGLYAAAARLSEVWYALPAVAIAAIFPVLLEGRADPQRWQQNLQRVLDGLFAAALIIALTMQIIAVPLVTLILGDAFAAAGPILAIHIWAGVFVFMREVFSRWLIAEDLLRYSLATHGIGALMNVSLNLLLIPRFGGAGAALGTVISYASAGWLSLFMFARTRPMALLMTRALLLPIRPRDLAGYLREIR